MLRLMETNLSYRPTSDTEYPVYRITGRTPDGCCIFYNTANNAWFIAWDGPWEYGLMEAKFDYLIYDNQTKQIKKIINIGFYQQSYGFGLPPQNNYDQAMWFKKSYLSPQIELSYRNVSWDNPFGKAIFFISSIRLSHGLTDGPMRIYDLERNEWTGIIAYALLDNGYNDPGNWSSGWYDLQFGINSSGKPPKGNNLSYPKPRTWAVGNGQNINPPYSIHPRQTKYYHTARQVMYNWYNPNLVIS